MASNPTTQNPPNTPLWKGGPPVAPEWWRFFFNLNVKTGDAAAGEVSTAPGSGLTGGGAVADGINLSIADNGVTNAYLRQSQPCSVMGRYANSPGNVGDIQAVLNGTVLVRQANQLGFQPRLDGIPVGENDAAPLVRCDSFRLDQAPVAESLTPTHSITISVNGVNYKIPLQAA